MLTKILPNFSRFQTCKHKAFLSFSQARFFASTDLGKLGEKYHEKMIKKLIQSHESLSIPSLNVESFADQANPFTTPLKSFGENVYRKVVNNKHFPKDYIKGAEIKGNYSKEIEEVDKEMLSMMHSNSLRSLYQYFEYDNKHIYTKIIFAFRDFIYQTHKLNKIDQSQIDQTLVKLATCFECLTLGFFLHNNLENLDQFQERLKTVLYGIPSSFGLVEKYLKDDKILLAGDFFHTKAAKLSSEFGIVEIPYYFALIEEALAKAIIKKDEINNKKETYDLGNQMFISYHEVSLVLALALKATYIIVNEAATITQLDTISNFALNFGAAWHLVSEYRKQETVPKDLQKKEEYKVKNFLEREVERLNQKSDLSALVNLREAHISQAEKNLLPLVSNENQVTDFVHNVLVPIIAVPFSVPENEGSSQKVVL